MLLPVDHDSDSCVRLNLSQVYDAALLMLRTWAIERRHEQDSPYYYAELPRGGRGAESNYTGELLHTADACIL